MPKKSRSSATTDLAPVAPGEMLVEEFLKPLEMTNYRLAKEIGVPAQRIGEIIAGRRSITADTDLPLCRFFGLEAEYQFGELHPGRAAVNYVTDRGALGFARRW